MGNNLSNSITRGFGFTIGRFMAMTLLGSLLGMKKSPPSPYKTNGLQKFLIFLLHFFQLAYLSNFKVLPTSLYHSLWEKFIIGYILLGWIPIWLLVRGFNYLRKGSKDNKTKELYKTEINNSLGELKQYPFVNLSLISNSYSSFDWERDKDTATLDQLQNIYTSICDILSTLKKFKKKGYDNDTIVNILNEELWLGMTEEHMRDMKGNPTKTEKETLKSGKIKIKHIYGNKTSGDVLTFEDGVLVSFKDR